MLAMLSQKSLFGFLIRAFAVRKQVLTSLSLLPALIAHNYGAIGFVIGLQHQRSALRFALQYRDELGIDLISVKHSTAYNLAHDPQLALAA